MKTSEHIFVTSTIKSEVHKRNRITINHLVGVLLLSIVAFVNYVIRSIPQTSMHYFYSNFQHTHSVYNALVKAPEYPILPRILYYFIYLISGDNYSMFSALFIISSLILMVIQASILTSIAYSETERDNGNKYYTYCKYSLLYFIFTFTYFDILSTTLTLAFLLCVVQKRKYAGVLLALAVFVKIWPVVLLPLLLLHPRIKREITSFIVTIVTLSIPTILAFGWSNFITPLTFQQHRGLQQEGVFTTPFTFVNTFKHTGGFYASHYNSIDVLPSMPGAHLVAVFTTVLLAVFILLTYFFAYQAWSNIKTNPTYNRELYQSKLLVLLSLTLVTGLITFNKVFSGNYIIWLMPLLYLTVQGRLAVAKKPEKSWFVFWAVAVFLPLLTVIANFSAALEPHSKMAIGEVTWSVLAVRAGMLVFFALFLLFRVYKFKEHILTESAG